jgi:hypothetical protein
MAIEASGFSGQKRETTFYLYNMMNTHVTAAMIRKRCHDGRVRFHQGIKVQGSREAFTAGCWARRSAHNTVPFSATLLRNSTSK